jgi:hypothetical protein
VSARVYLPSRCHIVVSVGSKAACQYWTIQSLICNDLGRCLEKYDYTKIEVENVHEKAIRSTCASNLLEPVHDVVVSCLIDRKLHGSGKHTSMQVLRGTVNHRR